MDFYVGCSTKGIMYITLITMTSHSQLTSNSALRTTAPTPSCMSDTSEILPYVIGTLLTIALIKWLFSKVEDRPIHSPSLYFSYTPDPESMGQLESMFPAIPRAYIVRELDRCDGIVLAAVDRLVLLAPDFMGFRGEETVHGNGGQVDTSPAITGAQSTHRNLLNAINNDHHHHHHHQSGSTSGADSIDLTKKNWDKVDVETRQIILMRRKREMLMKARESFCKRTSTNENE